MSAHSTAFDLDYPPSTRQMRLADNLAAQNAIDWVAELSARALPADIARVAARFRAVVEAGKPFAGAHDRCLLHQASHDRQEAAASAEEAALLAGFARAAAALEAEKGALPSAPFAGLGRMPRNMAGLRTAPALDLLMLPGDLAAALPAEGRGPLLAAAVDALPALAARALRSRLAALESGAPAEKAQRDRVAAGKDLALAIKALEEEARREKVWGRIAPPRHPFRSAVFLPLWLHRQVVDFGPFRRVLVNRAVRQWLVALLALLLLLLGGPLLARAVFPRWFGASPLAAGPSAQPVVTGPQPTATGRVDAIFALVTNQDDRSWRVITDCRPAGGRDTGTIAAGDNRSFLLGYGTRQSFHCPATLEGGTGSCTISWTDTCVIKGGVLGPGGPRR